MNQLTLLDREAVHGLLSFGYSEREAEFLRMTALHGGFFLRRQYCMFTRTKPGGADSALIDKVLSKGHATALEACKQTVVYHLGSRPFYRAIGEPDNRNRRLRPPLAIKNRLMALDYVLDNPGRYLGTERDKIRFFADGGIDTAHLPAKRFRSPGAPQPTTRFFVDKSPIGVEGHPNGTQTVHFFFIDEGLVTISRFDAFLAQYRRLFELLTAFRLTYVAANSSLFWEAETRFNAFVRGAKNLPRSAEAVDLQALTDHFKDRIRAESADWTAFNRSKLVQFREDRQTYSGSFFDTLFAAWKHRGEDALRTALSSSEQSKSTLHGHFSSHQLNHSYDLFESGSEIEDA